MECTVSESVSALELLRTFYPDSSRRTLQNWIRAGRFTVDGSPLKKECEVLREGQVLRSKETIRPPRIPGINILYEDRYLVAIDKPVGLLSVPLDDGASRKHALGLLRQHFDTDNIFAVHRIDRETSGVLLFARGKQSAEKLGEMFEKHALKREYFAIVEGRVKEDRGTWECPLLELPNFRVVPSIDGKMAITHFEVMRRSTKYSYMKFLLETGKKHQIRVHCQKAGHPVVGDERYGSTENPMRRLALHASSLEMIHPFTRKTLSFRAALPKAFKVLGA
jgi:tRNA pseudouridine32 synthase/23S rRNA pseudouridine746 synthase/23S rRNA pseudouridine1911/1915/1917 synthase